MKLRLEGELKKKQAIVSAETTNVFAQAQQPQRGRGRVARRGRVAGRERGRGRGLRRRGRVRGRAAAHPALHPLPAAAVPHPLLPRGRRPRWVFFNPVLFAPIFVALAVLPLNVILDFNMPVTGIVTSNNIYVQYLFKGVRVTPMCALRFFS